MNPYIEHEKIIKEVIFEFMALYGPSSGWDSEIKELFDSEIKKRVKEVK